ncbi:S-layer homology domain-containing protein [Sporobacter termitidis DSM 10068]|uniref:S-layer homology domain-containing protein n=1 Tax=Sporobacter termitidis DSM 10068 TaxID=1123282 RepID=A0A1M5YQW0_9FIRM|nr:S-layer homology domain-containing protein [Sporobacter termitidis]SHI14240.1 S-layer homology domain-containing protein [Sporobacter termitidis DSM 10068]
MKKTTVKILSLLLVIGMLLGLPAGAFAAAGGGTLDTAVEEAAAYIYRTVANPQVDSIGGEWAVLGLARSGYEVPDEYYQKYYDTLKNYVTARKGVLSESKYTENSRVIVALSAIGKDARDVAGYDLTKPLGDFDAVISQGINGPIWALIALDSGNYDMPENPDAKTQATRQIYIDELLSRQLADGGWSMVGRGGDTTEADPDITGMVLQALAKYQDQPAVKQATGKALSCVSLMQDASGGFVSWHSLNAESCAQIIVALAELGIPLDDSRFVKNGNTVLDALMSFRAEDGGFLHTGQGAGASNPMASEQALYALVAAQRLRDGKTSLYRMTDTRSIPEGENTSGKGLPGKHADVRPTELTAPGATFTDISGVNAHKNQEAIEALASRGIIDGMGSGLFEPDSAMTRAQFAAIVVRALGLTPKAADSFADVISDQQYAAYADTARTYEIVLGVGDGKFSPEGTVTRQEAAVMVARAARLCGMNTELDDNAVRDALAPFPDYMTAARWAHQGLAFCYSENILDQSDLNIQPTAAIKRCEAAQMLFNLLSRANLL